jgi:hypothetical protein
VREREANESKLSELESKFRHDSAERLNADYADITDVQNQTVAAFVVY